MPELTPIPRKLVHAILREADSDIANMYDPDRAEIPEDVEEYWASMEARVNKLDFTIVDA